MAKKSNTKVEIGSAFDLLPKSWEIVKRNWQAFAVVNIFAILSGLAAFSSDYDTNGRSQTLSSTPFSGLSGMSFSAILGIAGVFVAIFTAISIILFAMRMVLMVRSTESKEPTLSELFEESQKNWLWLRLIGLYIVSGLILIVGFLLLIIPGIIALGRVVMAGYFMVDKNLSIMDSLQASNEMGKKHPGKVWAAIGVMILVAIASSILGAIDVIGPLLGALLSIAFSLVLVLRYQQLKSVS